MLQVKKKKLIHIINMNKIEMMNQIKIDTMLHGYHAGFLFALLITVISFFCSFMLQVKKKEVDSHQ